MKKKALITGVGGQDGSYLAELLLEKDYEVYGMVRRHAGSDGMWRIRHLLDKIEIIEGDLLDQNSLINIISVVKPDEVYNLASQSFVPTSFTQPILTGEFTALGVTRMLEAIRLICPKARFFQASSSEMFGLVRETPQDEQTPFYPRSPYGVAKVYGHYITVNYRESYNMYAVSGIMFNHESPRRGEEFVTRKITRAAARIKFGLQDKLELGNLASFRDWGFAGDYMRAAWMMLQADEPHDYVVSTGKVHSVGEFVKLAFTAAGIDSGECVKINQAMFRPAEVNILTGDSFLIESKLGWKPDVSFEELVWMMVKSDLEKAEREARRDEGSFRNA